MLPSRRALLLCLAASLTAAGCAASQGAPPRVPVIARNYFPLRAGAAWSFDALDMEHGGASTLLVMRVTRDDGAGGYYVTQGNRGTPALYEYARGGVTRNGELLLRDPIAEGTRWTGRLGDSYVIARAGLTRTVPAGTFHDVVQVVRTGGGAAIAQGVSYVETYWYALGVGPIEAEVPVMLSPAETRRYRLTLRGYTLDGEL